MTVHRADDPQQRIEAAKAGDERAWRALYDDLAPAVHGYLRVRGARDAEDLTGEVFLHAARRIRDFEGTPAGFRSWIFTIAHHRLVDDHRARARRPLVLVEDVPEAAAVGGTELDALEALGVEHVRALLGQLTDDQREVLVLRLVGGLTIEEIGGLLGKSIGSTKQLQRRGLNSLRRLLAHDPTQDVPQ